MSKQVSITKINIKIGETEISLTPEQAKELQGILNETLGEKQQVINWSDAKRLWEDTFPQEG